MVESWPVSTNDSLCGFVLASFNMPTDRLLLDIRNCESDRENVVVASLPGGPGPIFSLPQSIQSLGARIARILEAAAHSHVYTNGFGHLAISFPLLVLWLVAVLFFDRKMYMVFASGQLLDCKEIGSGEVAFDTVGMVVAKRRSDLFRHWLLGFGSGDLLVKTAGANAQQFEMHNVLFVGSKLQLIQDMLQTREVVSGS